MTSINQSSSNAIPIFPFLVSNAPISNTPSVKQTNLTADEIQQFSWLNKTKPLASETLNLNLFAHEAAGAFVGDSRFEGHTFSNTLVSIINALKDSPNISNAPSLIPIFEKSLTYSKKFDELAAPLSIQDEGKLNLARKNQLSDFAALVAEDVKNLNDKERLVIPGGWRTSKAGGGHAVLYMIERKGSSFEFTVVNTGDGLNYHPGYVDPSGQSKYLPIIQFQMVPQSNLNEDFFQSLLGLKLIPAWDSQCEIEAADLYVNILPQLGEVVKPCPNPTTSPWSFIKPQRSEICSMKSLLETVRILMLQDNSQDPHKQIEQINIYKQFRFSFQRTAILKTCSMYFKDDVQWDRSTHKLISEATRLMARMAVKLEKKKLISDIDLKACQATVADIQIRLAVKKRKAKSILENSQFKPPIKLESPSALQKSFLKASTLLKTSGLDGLNWINHDIEKFAIDKKLSPKEALEKLKLWASVDQKETFAYNALALESLRHFPIPSSPEGTNFWDQIPLKDVRICLDGLNNITRIFLRGDADSNIQKPLEISRSTFIEMQTALAIADFLARRDPKNLLTGYKLPNFHLLEFATSPLTILHNPLDQARLKLLLDYFVPDKDLRTTFSRADKNAMERANSPDYLFVVPWIQNQHKYYGNITINNDTIKASAELKFYRQFTDGKAIKKKMNTNQSLPETIGFIASQYDEENPYLPAAIMHLRNIAIAAQIIPPTTKHGTPSEFSIPSKYNFTNIRLLNSNESYILGTNVRGIFTIENNKFPTPLMKIDDVERTEQNEIMSEAKTAAKSDQTILSVNAHDEMMRTLADLESRPTADFEDSVNQKSLLCHLLRPETLLPQIMQEPQTATKLMEVLNKHLDYFQLNKKWTTCLFFVELTNRCADYVHYAKKECPEKFESLPKEILRDYRKWVLEKLLPECKDEKTLYQIYAKLIGFYISKQSYMDLSEYLDDYATDYITYSILNNLQDKSVTINSSNFDAYQQKQFTILSRHYIANFFETNEKARNQILNNVVKTLTHQNIDLEWKKTVEGYKANGYEINLSNATLNGSSSFLNLISNSLLSNVLKNHKNLFNGISKTERISEDEYIIHDKHGKTNIHKEKNSVIITRKIDDTDYTLAAPAADDPAKNNKFTLPFFDKDSSLLWTSNTIKKTEVVAKTRLEILIEKVKLIIPGKGSSAAHTLAFSGVTTLAITSVSALCLALIHKICLVAIPIMASLALGWVILIETGIFIALGLSVALVVGIIRYKLKPKPPLVPIENDVHYLVQNPDGKSYYIDGKIKVDGTRNSNANPLLNISGIYDQKDRSKSHILINPKSYPEYDVFSQFANSDHIMFWAKQGKPPVLDEILMPDLNRQFNVKKNDKGEEKIYSSQENGYYVSKNQLEDKRKNWPPFIVLENDQGKCKVLMRQIIKGLDQANRSDFDPTFSLQCGNKVIVYDLEKNQHKYSLKSNSTFEAIHFGWVHLNSKHYMQALKALDTLQVHDPLTSDEIDLLKEFLLKDKCQDKHPLSVLFRIKLLHIALKNNLQFPQNFSKDDIKEFRKVLNENYRNYLENIANMSAYRLSLDEEKEILKIIIKNCYEVDNYILSSPYFVARYQFLLEPRYTAINPLSQTTYSTNSLNILNKQKLQPFLSSDAYSKFTPNLTRPLPYPSLSVDYNYYDHSNLLSNYYDHSKLLSNRPTLDLSTYPKTNLSLPKDLDAFDAKADQTFKNLKNSPSRKPLDELFQQQIKVLENEEINLVSFANRFSERASTINALQHQGRAKKPLVFDEIVFLFEQGSRETYREKTYLSDTDIEELDNRVANYLVQSTRIHQLKRIIDFFGELEKITDKDEKALLEKQIEEDFGAVRKYSFAKIPVECSRRFLVLEHQSQVLLREKQIITLLNIASDQTIDELLLELGTGSGKSKVLAPLLQRLRHFKKLVFNIWPQSLFQTNKEDMKNLASKNFGQRSEVFEFDRNSPTDEQHLNFILTNLITALKEGRQISTTPESLQSFELKYLELIYINTLRKVDSQSIALMQVILKMIQDSEFHIDEAHINLSPRHEVNFTLGNPSSEPIERIVFVEKIFRFLLTDEVNNLLGIREDKQRFASIDQINVAIKKLAIHLADDLKILPEQKNSYMTYVMGGEPADWMYGHPHQDLLVLLRQQATKLLPVFLQKSVNVNFGLSHKYKEIKYAKPYNGNDSPIEGAEYENIYETLDKTYLTYLYQGLSQNNLWDLIKHLQDQSLRDSRELQTATQNTQSYRDYQALFGDKLGNLHSVDLTLINKNFDHYKNDQNIIFYYITNLVAATITKYKYKLKSTPQDLLNMAKTKIAMTATPGKPENYRIGIEYRHPGEHLNGADQKVLGKLKSDNTKVHVVDANKPQELLSLSLEKLQVDTRLLIDVGALYKGLSNRAVAEEILYHFADNSDINGVVFFDDQERIVVLEKGRKDPISINQCSLPPKNRFTYCDQRHAFGTDTKQFSKAKGLVTFDTLTTKDELLQGVGRLRQYLGGQSVEMLVSSKTKSMITKNDNLNIEDIILYANENQEEQQDDLSIRSARQQMDTMVRYYLITYLKENSLIFIFKDFEPLLLEQVDLNLSLPPKKTIAKPVKNEDSNPLLAYCDMLIDKVKKLTQLHPTNVSEIVDNLKNFKNHIIDISKRVENRAKARNKPVNLHADLGNEVEVQSENDVNQEIDAEQNSARDNDFSLRKPQEWPTNFSFYDRNWIPAPPAAILPVQPNTAIKNSIADDKVQTVSQSIGKSSAAPNVNGTVDKTQGIVHRILSKIGSGLVNKLKIISITIVSLGAGAGLAFLAYKVSLIAWPIIAALPLMYTIPGAVIAGLALLSVTVIVGYFAVKRLKKPPTIPNNPKIEFKTPIRSAGVGNLTELFLKNRVRDTKGIQNTQEVFLHDLNDILSKNGTGTEKAADLFEDHSENKIQFTNNFLMLMSLEKDFKPVIPLSREQKTAYEVLIVQDVINGKKRWNVIVGDQSTDAKFWREKLNQITPEQAKAESRRVCLYDLVIGVAKDSPNPFGKDELENDEELQKLLTIVKLYNGNITYNDAQRKVIQFLAKTKEHREILREFFERAIIYHPKIRKQYKGSWIQKFFSSFS